MEECVGWFVLGGGFLLVLGQELGKGAAALSFTLPTHNAHNAYQQALSRMLRMFADCHRKSTNTRTLIGVNRISNVCRARLAVFSL